MKPHKISIFILYFSFITDRAAVEKRLALLQDKQQFIIETEYCHVDDDRAADSF